MTRVTAIILAVSAAISTATAAIGDVKQNGKTIDCYCTDTSGARVELGETICLTVGGRMFMAQCQMSLNVPMWREVQAGCLSSGLSRPFQGFEPAGDAPLVDAHI